MKLFLAIPLTDQIKNKIYEKIETFRREYAFMRWIPPENYHINLLYFGEIEKNKIDNLIELLKKEFYNYDKFNLYSSSGGIFIKNNIVLRVDFYLSRILKEIVDNLHIHAGKAKIHNFIPHVSIARYKIPSKQQYLLLKRKLIEKKDFDIELEVKDIVLYESINRKPFPEYVEKHKFKLGE